MPYPMPRPAKWTSTGPGKDSEAVLTITDDGKGFDPDVAESAPFSGHFGLAILRYRTEGLRGRFDVESEAGCGVTIRSGIPTESAGAPSDEFKTATFALSGAEAKEAAS